MKRLDDLLNKIDEALKESYDDIEALENIIDVIKDYKRQTKSKNLDDLYDYFEQVDEQEKIEQSKIDEGEYKYDQYLEKKYGYDL